MDIQILHALESFRTGIGAFLKDFFLKMTFFGELPTVIIIMAVLYWCINKQFGTYLLLGWNYNRIVNGFLKITACAYRPWVRDPSLTPDATALTTATGYSFPSGHSTNAASIYGGVAIRREFRKGLRILMAVLVALIAFSRIYLCVHTPQDILVGVCLSLLVMWGTVRLMRLLEQKPEKDILIVVLSLAVSSAVAVWASVKSYPVDYDAAGKVLVDGSKMANDTFKSVGYNLGFFIGWVLERRFVRFSSDGSVTDRIFRMVGGVLGYYVVNLVICSLLKNIVTGVPGTILTQFLPMFYIVFLYPWIVSIVQKKRALN